MFIKYLKIATVAFSLTPAAFAADRSFVVIQGKGTSNVAGSRVWTLCEQGRVGRLGSGPAFTVPQGRYLVITEAAFTVRGGATKFARAASFVVTMGSGPDAFDLAEVTDRLLPYMDNNTVSKRFTPGLMVPSGVPVTGTQKQIQPGGGSATLDVTFYGFLVPNGQGW